MKPNASTKSWNSISRGSLPSTKAHPAGGDPGTVSTLLSSTVDADRPPADGLAIAGVGHRTRQPHLRGTGDRSGDRIRDFAARQQWVRRLVVTTQVVRQVRVADLGLDHDRS